VFRGDEEAGPEAEAQYKRLRYLMREVGFSHARGRVHS
jgi:hypothetical protein